MENLNIKQNKNDNIVKELSKTKKKFWFASNKFDTKDQIFKVVLTGLLLSISVGTSMLEFKVPIMGASMPLRVFDILIIMLAIPIIKIWYSLAMAIVEPWLHLALDPDHPPIQMVFDDIANVLLVLSFVVVFYKLFRFENQDYSKSSIKTLIIKRSCAGAVLIPFNAIVSSLCFALTLVVLNNTSLAKPDEYIDYILHFYKHPSAILFILVAIEMARFILIYVLFAIVQKKLGQLNRFTIS